MIGNSPRWQHASPPVLICESSRHWASWWRSRIVEPTNSEPRLIETRSLNECRREIASHPAAFVIVELTPTNAVSVLQWLDEPPRGSVPTAPVVTCVVAERKLRRWEMIVREAGAIGWATSPPQLWQLATMAERFAAQHTTVSTEITASVWANLPWRAVEPAVPESLELIDPIHFIEEE